MWKTYYVWTIYVKLNQEKKGVNLCPGNEWHNVAFNR